MSQLLTTLAWQNATLELHWAELFAITLQF